MRNEHTRKTTGGHVVRGKPAELVLSVAGGEGGRGESGGGNVGNTAPSLWRSVWEDGSGHYEFVRRERHKNGSHSLRCTSRERL